MNTTSVVKPFEILHVNIRDPRRTATYDGYKLFLSIVDDYSRATWIFLLSHKSNVVSMLVSFISYIETQFHTQVQIVRSDNGHEFADHYAIDFLYQERYCVPNFLCGCTSAEWHSREETQASFRGC